MGLNGVPGIEAGHMEVSRDMVRCANDMDLMIRAFRVLSSDASDPDYLDRCHEVMQEVRAAGILERYR